MYISIYQEYLAVIYTLESILGEIWQNNNYLLLTPNTLILGKNPFTVNMAQHVG